MTTFCSCKVSVNLLRSYRRRNKNTRLSPVSQVWGSTQSACKCALQRARVIVNFLLSVSGMTSRKPFRRSGAAGARRACATTVKRRQRKKERNIFLWMWLLYGKISSRHVMAWKIAAVITTGYQPHAVKKNTLSWLNSRICFGWILFTVCVWGIPTHRH